MKGQTSFFYKILFIVFASMGLFFVYIQIAGFQESTVKERGLSDFKMETLNTFQKLLTDGNCLAFYTEGAQKAVMDKDKLDIFVQDYAETEPKCAKALGSDYQIKIVQFPKTFTLYPGDASRSYCDVAWVPNSGDGNSISLVFGNGKEIRRHWTVLSGNGNPSRTAVDSKGNVWVGNRGTNTVVKIALSEDDCIDKNGNGKIETSKDSNDDGEVDESEMIPFSDDECVVGVVPLRMNVRAVCIDGEDNVYAGSFDAKKLYKISGDGTLLESWSLSFGPYGCAVDKNNIIWIAGVDAGKLGRLNATSGELKEIDAKQWGHTYVYGIWPWPDGKYVVFSTYTENSVIKITADENPIKVWDTLNLNLRGARGVYVDGDGNVYAAGSLANTAVKLNGIDGTITEVTPTCSMPTGISEDRCGNLWTLCYGDGGIMITGKDLTEINSFLIRGQHYCYSDFTGALTKASFRLFSEGAEPIQINVSKEEWQFGVRNFSPSKARFSEIDLSLPVSIRYNETFSAEGVAYIHSVKGELESLYSLLEDLCGKTEKDGISKEFHFSFPVTFSDQKLCMEDVCKKFVCAYQLEFENLSEGDYVLRFDVDPAIGKIVVKK